MTHLVDAQGRPMRPTPTASYDAGAVGGQDLAGWLPGLESPDAAYLPQQETITSRIHDLVRNDGWASGAVSALVNSVVGADFRFSSRPDWRALGITFDQAAELGRQIETVWRTYAHDPRRLCDVGRRHTMPQLFAQLIRHRIIDGECFVAALWRPRRNARLATAFQPIHPARVSNPDGEPDSDRLRAGVRLDADGAPVGYYVQRAHPGDVGLGLDAAAARLDWTHVAREWPWGRPQLIHHHAPDEIGQTRGVSPLAPVVRRMKMNSQYEQAEVQAAVANAVLAAYLETNLPPETAAQAFDDSSVYQNLNKQRLNFYSQAPVKLNGFRIPILPVGDRVNFPTAARPNDKSQEFVDAGLRNVAAATGLNPSQISKNYRHTNYSSERAAMVEAWKTITMLRKQFGAEVGTPMLAAVVEEAIDRGMIQLPAGAPPFWENLGAYLAGTWLGPARGWVDPSKEAQGAQRRLDAGVSTLQAEAAEQGMDVEEVLNQQAREQAMRDELGLGQPGASGGASDGGDTEPDAVDEPGSQGAEP